MNDKELNKYLSLKTMIMDELNEFLETKQTFTSKQLE